MIANSPDELLYIVYLSINKVQCNAMEALCDCVAM